MIKVAFVRGKYFNNYEGQNYRISEKEISITGFASKFPIDSQVTFPVVKLPSLSDFDSRLMKIISNRTLGDSQILFGLENFRSQFDLFHSADPHYYYSYQLAKLRKKNLIKKLVLTSWETIPFNNESVYRKRLIKKFSKKYADLFLCYTQKAKKSLIEEGEDEKKVKVIKLGVDLSLYKKRIHKANDLILLFVGRLVEEKGLMDLYTVFKKFKKGRLRIVGKGPLEQKLRQLIRKDGLQNRVSIERKDYKEMNNVYSESDIFIMPSMRTKTWEEQYGMVLVEAMASGLPIVAYKTGAIAENLDDAGILVKENNIDDLLRQITRILQNKNLAFKLGTMSRKRAEKYFDSRKTAVQIANLYETVNSNSH